ncbi:hypothetical protein POM88_050394 [Heracleum sosnowskyi]|uniref:C3H1-type domain-containing protein n=1 Tax=Heracleum sosnowskyi TaxID=360622 RepID=A0AAD8M2L8_9APIA|nr:hypothetical protein POM88_050394 [Heracleum sosnowskyi]
MIDSMFVAGGSANVLEFVKLLLDESADANCINAEGNRPYDLIIPFLSSLFDSKCNMLELMLNDCADVDNVCTVSDNKHKKVSLPSPSKDGTEGKDHLVDLSLPDIKNGMYGSDVWTECPFVQPSENARRRDPRKFHYSCVPCSEFRKGTCRKGHSCKSAHGIFECWLHPAQYRTRLCKDETGCGRYSLLL